MKKDVYFFQTENLRIKFLLKTSFQKTQKIISLKYFLLDNFLFIYEKEKEKDFLIVQKNWIIDFYTKKEIKEINIDFFENENIMFLLNKIKNNYFESLVSFNEKKVLFKRKWKNIKMKKIKNGLINYYEITWEELIRFKRYF